MKKLTCLLLSFLIFATPLFAIKEAVYNAQGVKVGYIEKVNGQTIYYDKNGFNISEWIDMQSLINQELDNIERREKAYGNTSVDPALDSFFEAYNYWLSTPRSKMPSPHKELYYKRCVNKHCQMPNYDYSKACFECGTSLATANPQKNKFYGKPSYYEWVYVGGRICIFIGGIALLVKLGYVLFPPQDD